jgi:branched-chain amino acid transport system ATP-binding protein
MNVSHGRVKERSASNALPAATPQVDATPMLAVTSLSKAFGGVRAVRDVSFALARGEVLAMIGPNGAGKTTCFNLLNGQLPMDSGDVRLQGRSIVGMKPRQIWRLGVGRTFQITATFSSMTVRENVQMALLSHHRRLRNWFARARDAYLDEADRLLELVGMAEQAQRACSVLAYGDLKRVELAVALANSPGLLLMDEPAAGMAPRERVALMELVRGIVRRDRIAVLFTEHDMDVVFGSADRVIVLSRGALIANGTPQAVRANEEVQRVYLGSRSHD